MAHCTFPEEVSLFEKPCNNVAYEKIQYVDYRPTSSLSSGGSIDFTISPLANQYIDLKKTYLFARAKITKADGTATNIDKVAPVNLTLHSLFNQVDVHLQQELVSSIGSQTYGYKAYIETMLEYGPDAKRSQLQAQLFYKDKAGDMDGLSLPKAPGVYTDEETGGMVTRWSFFVDGQTVDMMAPLMADICQQNRLILNGVEIQFKLWPSKDAFRLVSTEEDPSYKLEIVEACLKACKVTPTPTLLLAHTAALKESNALYPYQKTQIKTFNIVSGQHSFHLDDLFQGDIPSRVVITMVKSKAFSGDYTKNPYNMETFNLNSLGAYVNDESVPGKPLQMNFSDANFVTAYHSLFAGLDKDGKDWGNGIKLAEFKLGYAFFIFDLLPGDQTAVHKANVRVDGTFSEPLPENITIIIYAKFPSMLEITETRAVKI